MGTNYEFNMENFEEIFNELRIDETDLGVANTTNSERNSNDFDLSGLENLFSNEVNSNTSRCCSNSENNNLEALEVSSNGNGCSGVANCRQYYERGLREGLEQGFTRGYQKGYCRGKDVGLREGFNDGLEKGLSKAEELARAAYEKGFKCGYKKGYSVGYQKGYKDGAKAGFERGAQAGFNEGFRKGYERAVRDILNCARAAANNSLGTCSNGNSNSNCGCNGTWRNC